MSVIKIRTNNMNDFDRYIPQEYELGIKSRDLKIYGGLFGDEPAGVIIYEKKDARTVVLKWLYVAPEYRRLGVATELVEELFPADFEFSYEATDDRATLEPFFDAVDISTQRIDAYFADFSLFEVTKALRFKNIEKAGMRGTFYEDFSGEEDMILTKWLSDEFGEKVSSFEEYEPISVISISNGKVDAAIIMRKDTPSRYDLIQTSIDGEAIDILVIDYLFQGSGDKKLLPGMINKLVTRLNQDYKYNTRIQAFLMNDKSLSLYKGLFDIPTVTIPIIISEKGE